MPVVYVLNPVTGYDERFPDPLGGYTTMPFDMSAVSPPWYLPLLGWILAPAAIAQLLAVCGVVRRDAVLPPSPWSAWLLLLPLAFLLASANLVSDRITRATAPAFARAPSCSPASSRAPSPAGRACRAGRCDRVGQIGQLSSSVKVARLGHGDADDLAMTPVATGAGRAVPLGCGPACRAFPHAARTLGGVGTRHTVPA
ncbi:hypothetical protein ACTMTI_39265 [Nonomuraea sp. H19]|uniref:hypothetical protein n=1 Tax=Nonomuraea sp. H19 TaxID=3452206 RepID=UPI003F8C1108